MSDTVLVALLGVIGVSLGGGGLFTALLARKAQIKQAEAAAKTAEIAAQRQERDDAIQAWKDVVEPLRQALADTRAELARLKADLDEERKVSAALAAQNETMHRRKR